MVAETSIRPIRAAKTCEGAATVVMLLSLQIFRAGGTGNVCLKGVCPSEPEESLQVNRAVGAPALTPGVVQGGRLAEKRRAQHAHGLRQVAMIENVLRSDSNSPSVPALDLLLFRPGAGLGGGGRGRGLGILGRNAGCGGRRRRVRELGAEVESPHRAEI